MEEENKYDQESIRELLSWAQDTLKNKTYPEGGLVLDKCIKVIDCKSHIEAMIQMISKNWENPTFYPTIDLMVSYEGFTFSLIISLKVACFTDADRAIAEAFPLKNSSEIFLILSFTVDCSFILFRCILNC